MERKGRNEMNLNFKFSVFLLIAIFIIGCKANTPSQTQQGNPVVKPEDKAKLHSQMPMVKSMKLAVKHRIYTKFYEEHVVKVNEEFPISDTAYTAKVTEFFPDFVIDKETKKAASRSNECKNPAVKIEVYENGKKIEESWAFGNMLAPHYYSHSILAFVLLNYELDKK